MKSRKGRAAGTAEKGGRNPTREARGRGEREVRVGMRQEKGVRRRVGAGTRARAEGKNGVVW